AHCGGRGSYRLTSSIRGNDLTNERDTSLRLTLGRLAKRLIRKRLQGLHHRLRVVHLRVLDLPLTTLPAIELRPCSLLTREHFVHELPHLLGRQKPLQSLPDLRTHVTHERLHDSTMESKPVSECPLSQYEHRRATRR